MEDLKQSRILKILFIVFIVVSIIHVLYASFTYRGLYCDGSYYMLKLLNQLSNGDNSIVTDIGHPRFFVMALIQIPVIIAHSFLFIKNKFVLMFIYTFFQFLIPLLALFWSWCLAKRTNKIDIFFWHLLTYGGIILLYQIFSVTESIQGIGFHFILWNYLTAKMEYTKKDFVCIMFLIVMMFGTYEYTAYLGIFFFLCHFYYVLQEKSLKNQTIKTIIGFLSLGASLYTIWYMLQQHGEGSEILRFLGEGINVIPQMLHLNSLITIVAFILLILFAFKKTSIKNWEIYTAVFIFYSAFQYLFCNLTISLVPMWETHLRTIPCWWIMLVFLIIHLKDMMRPNYTYIRWHNLICIALLCAIFQTSWQINDTYFWNKNIKYLKKELIKSKSPLYIPSEHREISSFLNKDLRRYIWHSFYAVTSIAVSDSYKQKTLLVNYDEPKEEGNGIFRNLLYVVPDEENIISLPVGLNASIKNDFWDLTDCAQALDKYNKEHNILTDK